MDRRRSSLSLVLITVLLLAQIPFSLGEWIAVPQAPDESGIYDLIIQASHGESTGSFPLQFEVIDTAYNTGDMSIDPIYPFGRTSPIRLTYDIHFNGSRDYDMLSNNLTLYYQSGDTLLASGEMVLSWDNETNYWYTDVNVPLKGDYVALLYVSVVRNSAIYTGEFATTFSSDSPSSELVLDYDISERVLIPSESFDASLEAKFGGEYVPDLEIFKVNLFGTVKSLVWEPIGGVYETTLVAPTEEGIYILSLYGEDQDFANSDKIYVAEVAKAKSARCPIAYEGSGGCDDMKDVRKCVSDYKAETITITEDQLVGCYIDAAGDTPVGAITCNGNYKGDFDGDAQLTVQDLVLMQNIILPLSQSARQEYKKCADYDLDDDVDEQDLECLSKGISQAWYGDFSGGICFDLVLDSPLKGDLDGNFFVDEDDAILMRDLIEAADADIEMPDEVLEAVDFDQDERITLQDGVCLNHFLGMDFDEPSTLLISGQTIPSECMAIYTLDQCLDIAGDINGDMIIDQIDEILIMLINREQVTGYSLGCADVNKDSRISDEDVECIVNYNVGDREAYYICIGCDEYTPSEYREAIEICGDGYDNNCDGLIDRTSTGPDDMCNCGPHTECMYVYDNDKGAIPGVADGNVAVCRKLSWEGADDATGGSESYRWTLPQEMLCGEDKECETIECSETLYKCAFSGTTWDWYDDPAKLEHENDDPLGSPKVCEDGYDNDCGCGDRTCKELEAGNMFSSWQFWAGLILGAILAIFCAPCAVALFYLSLAASAATIFFSEELGPEWSAALSGFSMGVGLGNIVGSVANMGAEAGKQGAVEAGKEAGKEAAKETMKEAGKEATKEGVQEAAKVAAEEAAKEAGEQAATEAAKEAGKNLADEAVKESIKTAGEEAAKEAGKEAAKEAGKMFVRETSNIVVGTAINMGTSIAQATMDFVSGFVTLQATGSSVLGSLMLGYASQYAAQEAAMVYAEKKAEWITHAQSCSQ